MSGYYTFSVTGRVTLGRRAGLGPVFLETSTGREVELGIADEAFPVVEDETISLVYGRRNSGERAHLFYVYNHDRQRAHVLTPQIREIRGSGWPLVLAAAIWWTFILAAAFATFWAIHGNPVDTAAEGQVLAGLAAMLFCALVLVFWMVRDSVAAGIDRCLISEAERALSLAASDDAGTRTHSGPAPAAALAGAEAPAMAA